ncbi:AMP-binding protein [bacterium]|nr:AMP-binding protein [bacterium]
MNTKSSIYTIFYNLAKSNPEKICIYDKHGTGISYHDVFVKSLKMASILNKAGISKGVRVSVMLENSPLYFYVFLALSRLEAVIIPINTQYKSLGLRHILSDSKATAIIYDIRFKEQTESALEVLDQCTVQLISSDDENDDLSIDKDISPFGGPFNPKKSDDFLIYYSAGTLGPPKGAIYSNERLMNNINAVHDLIHLKRDDIILIGYPFYHYFTQVCGLANVLFSGAAMIPVDNKDIYKDLSEDISSRCKIIIDTPDQFSAFLNDEETRLPKGLHYCLTGGQAVEKSLPDEFKKRFNVPLYQSYGMVEAGPVISINMNSQKEGSIGIAVHDTTLSIMKDGKLLRQGRYGNFAMPDTQLVEKYCGRFRQDKRDIKEGWFYSPDVGYRDFDGYLYFLDREVNKIQLNGFDVFPEVVENKLKSYENIKEAAVIGITGLDGQEAIEAYLVLHRSDGVDKEDLFNRLKTKLPKYQIPKEILFVNHLPKNISGKVSRQTLRKNAVNRTTAKLEE